jgi:hypothetical protein
MTVLVVLAIIGQSGAILAAIISGLYARSAARLSKPTANGFATTVKDALCRIEGKIDRHIETHANEGIKKR